MSPDDEDSNGDIRYDAVNGITHKGKPVTKEDLERILAEKGQSTEEE